MVSGVDYNALQAQAVETGDEQAVTVNTRDLIDKVLSRYAREWTTLRELIQNAADAGATRVKIKIETTPSVKVPTPQADDPATRLRHVMHNHTVSQWVIENDGQRFSSQDWSRLTEIAKGNPDETKIGAFGVGFYSVFDISDKPFVLSGSEALRFYWKGDALFTKRLKLGYMQNTDTTFLLPVRDGDASVPQGRKLLSLCQFLTGSMTFVGLQSIDLWLDEWRMLHLQRTTADSVTLNIPNSISRTTSDGLMQIKSVTQEAVQLEAEWIGALAWTSGQRTGGGVDAVLEPAKKSLFSFFRKGAESQSQSDDKPPLGAKTGNASGGNLTAICSHKNFFHINKASIQTSIPRNLNTEFLRSRKKPPPEKTSLSYLSQSYEERAASKADAASIALKLFSSVVPSTKGYVYIGFATSQTTGLGAHLSIPSIVPTVEREAIDLNSQYIKVWNMELLRVAGIVARISWSSVLANLRQQTSRLPSMAKGKALEVEELQAIVPAVKHLYKEFELLSTRGIVPIGNARVALTDLSFVEELPVIPEAMADAGLIKRLRESGDLQVAQVDDIVWILENSKSTRTPSQLQKLIAFICASARAKTISKREIRALLDSAIATDEEGGSTKTIALSQIKEYVNPDKITPSMPLPPTTIPFKYTKTLSRFDTEALGLEELQPVKWLQWLVVHSDARGRVSTEHDIEKNPSFASNVLRVLSKQWSGLNQEGKTAVTNTLENRTVIPTKMGMKKPSDAYFSSVKLFQDLPVIQELSNVKEPFLAFLGVRRTLEIGVVFDRLMGGASHGEKATTKWSHVDLVKYLVSVWADVPERDRERLRSTPILPAEGLQGTWSDQLFRISELYEPSDSLRRLGLRTLQWPGGYNADNREGKLLHALGLRDAPTYADLVHIIAAAGQSKNTTLRDFALQYYINNYQLKGYDTSMPAENKVAFLPVQGLEDKLSAPSDCFTNERATLLRFDILRSDLHRHALRFGVQSDPPIDRCVQRLIRKPPQSSRQAREIFIYMAQRLGGITRGHADILGGAKIVPVTNKDSSEQGKRPVRHLSPRECFLGDGADLANVFDFVDFGPEASMFLLHCGSKHKPETSEIARALTRGPAKFLQELGVSGYMELLIIVSRAWETLKKDKSLVEAMKQAPFLLASKETASDASPSNHAEEGEDEDSRAKVWHIAKASEVVMIDEIVNYHIFKAHLLAAPQQDEGLETMYLQLGVPELGSLITQRQNTGNVLPNQSAALKLQSIVLERAPLFFYDYQKDSIRYDGKWLEKNLTVRILRRITVRKWLKGLETPHEESKTATLRREESGAYILLITDEYDMWQVSQVLTNLLLHRSKYRDVVVLESLLASSLRSLQQRGFNVEKWLRQKEKENKIAQEAQQKRLQQEQREREERQALERELEAQRGLNPEESGHDVPGQFPESDETKAEKKQEPEGILENIGKRLGFDFGLKPRPTAKTVQKEAVHPPDDFESDSDGPPLSKPPDKPMTPRELDDLVQKAIGSSRPDSSTNVQERPSMHKVEEMHTMCDPKPGMNIVHVGEMLGLRVLIDDAIISSSKEDGHRFMLENREGLEQFATVLHACAAVYRMSSQGVHIFYDASGGTMAFNRSAQNSMFFNYRFFKEHGHLDMVRQGNKADPINSWALTMAHEMAHHIEGSHNTMFQNVMQAINEKHTFRIYEIAKGAQPPTKSSPAPAAFQQPRSPPAAPGSQKQPPEKISYYQKLKR
ncbi:MAG: hypothetical protein LQ352_003888 [Teloschistes flavicans]|nr:MAG: hypothetical protein LQ352_003888 [Teloschistes flavicans]